MNGICDYCVIHVILLVENIEHCSDIIYVADESEAEGIYIW